MLFGATGDLAKRKLLPGLYHLTNAGFIPGCRIIGVSLDDLDADGFRQVARQALDGFFIGKLTEGDWAAFSQMRDCVPLAAGAAALKSAVSKAEASIGQECRRLHYLSVPPSLFEPIWNRNFIDHVQIDVPETLGLGQRSAFYEQTGAYRDMVVTHWFQILAFMATEPLNALAPAPSAGRKTKSSAACCRSSLGMWCVAGTPVTAMSRGWTPKARPKPSLPSSALSTTGAGLVCRFSCVPVNVSPQANASFPSPSASRPKACFHPARVWARRSPIT